MSELKLEGQAFLSPHGPITTIPDQAVSIVIQRLEALRQRSIRLDVRRCGDAAGLFTK
ncbi:MAG: hypothetical protein AMXMBFR13_25770 [Phycisphaerae bacterium]